MPLQSRRASEAITGVILAGGRGRRMNGEDKGLILLNGKALYQHVLQRLQPQVTNVCISANRNIARYRENECPVIPDSFPDYPGPLAGMLSALRFIDTEWAAFVACDTPFIPPDLVARLWSGKGQAAAVWVHNDDRDHPTLALLHRSVADRLESYLSEGDRKLLHFLQQIGGHSVIFKDNARTFMNINTPEDLIVWQEKH